MKHALKFTLTILLVISILTKMTTAGSMPWQKISFPTVGEVAQSFLSPPVEYGMTFYWGWDGNVTEEVMARDMDGFLKRNVRLVTLEPGYKMGSPYLSEGWFENVKLAVELARQRGMRVWLVDEGKYPSGFAGGKFSAERPELRMQALVVAERIKVESGHIFSRTLSPEMVSAVAVNRADQSNQLLDIREGKLTWTAPQGDWQVWLIQHEFRTSQTRAVNNPTGGKDTSNSLCDYLDPKATEQFLEFTHEQYKKVVGSEFGKTVLGFRGDEPDYSIKGIPWSPVLFEEFQHRKGYDIQPYTASFFVPQMTEEQKRAKADYWDVWSDLFSENFFGIQAQWCKENDLQYLVHLNKEDNMPALVAHEGDFFKAMRHVQMPGVDAIWNQIWPGKVTDYPKYASSAAHVFGKPRAFTESFAAYRTEPTVEQAKWVLDHQFVRGINMVEVMFVPASSNGKLGLSGWLMSEQFPAVAEYINRTSYILSQGRPAAQIALYHPTTSIWLGDDDANTSTLEITKDLLEQQRDFDFIDEQALCSILTLEGDTLKNLSDQCYRAVIIPSITAISKKALDTLRKFADSGGQVIFIGRTPSMVVDKTFLQASDSVDLSWALTEPSGKLTDRVTAALPQPDVELDQACPTVKYTHRTLKDAEIYFFFNESDQIQSKNVTLAGEGKTQIWDAMNSSIELIESKALEDGRTQVSLVLEPYETRFIVIGKAPSKM